MTVPGSVWPRSRRRVGLVVGRGFDALGQAEVQDLDVAVVRDEDVVGLQVAVDDALAVRGGEALGDLQRPVHGLPLRDGRAVELAAQRLALEQLRDGVGRRRRACRSRGSRGCSDARARRPPWPRARSARARPVVRGQLRREDLDRDVAVQLRVARAVDLAHPARAERREDLVGTETCSGGERHRGARRFYISAPLQ